MITEVTAGWASGNARASAGTPDPSDRRGVLLNLTAAGQTKLDDYIELGSARERALLSGLSAEDKRQLNRLLDRLLASLHSDLGG
ncbi:MAG TPA: MarR family winged helix-turn-helix transcriptional regulator [Solirubrobacteraceae bacterium]|jgi:DNA-binding MarR family transcriptional regulator